MTTTPRPARRTRRKPLDEAKVDAVLALVLELDGRAPAAPRPGRLEALLRELAERRPRKDPDEIEDMVWAHWISHRDRRACTDMAVALEAMGAGAFDLARPLLDALVRRRPDWAEAWHKRGILAFIQKRDADALGDIERTLLLEPRHFGAVSSFGQICLRHGRLTEARAAFQVALAINPHLEGLAEAVAELGQMRRAQWH
ncbi:tetratricopeptide repeat protein [Alsobacter sp. SYSU M60028]|uniref:Tetratricopeptide repeat protein n=1 Tax=Alsobacter ponti TaxID=2962936 RepID=A0ABT1LDT4_9HYPH|nr:tetratricopeptide repeat protein [Alsobacter ponti]MCP8938885.1 tetratricopeptide repeat protein [Alsobacter ponti]